MRQFRITRWPRQQEHSFRLNVESSAGRFATGVHRFGDRFKMSDNVALRADFDWFDTDIDTDWSLGVGVQFYFGQ